MIRTYFVGFSTLGKIHIAVKDGFTEEITATGIWSAGELDAAMGFLRDHLEEDAGCFLPRIAPETREDIEGHVTPIEEPVYDILKTGRNHDK